MNRRTVWSPICAEPQKRLGCRGDVSQPSPVLCVEVDSVCISRGEYSYSLKCGKFYSLYNPVVVFL